MSKNTLTREQAEQLYRDLKKNMDKLKMKKTAAANIKNCTSAAKPNDDKAIAKEIAASIKSAMKRDDSRSGDLTMEATIPMNYSEERAAPIVGTQGTKLALITIVIFALMKVGIAAMEWSGVANVTPAHANIVSGSVTEAATVKPVISGQFSPEEVQLLKSLDARRAELEERAKKLEVREQDLAARDQELVVRITELKGLTDKLKGERERDERKRSTQLDQLANVYGSMNPQEAAQLLQQLDMQIALSLIQRMPEKRIGQILALMTPDKALSITRMLTGKAAAADSKG
jgi:flagellar motility protein MotE (MotC chaperone)